MARVRVSGTRGRWFESSLPDNSSLVPVIIYTDMTLEVNAFQNPFAKKSKPEAVWNYTSFLEDRMKDSSASFYEEQGQVPEQELFRGRPMIARDRPINGGVYATGAGNSEAIVVDDQKDVNLDKVYQILQERLKAHIDAGENIKGKFLTEVYQLVQEVMPYDMARTQQILSKIGADNKVYLSSYINGGVCRHQALLVGYLLERLTKDGIAGGKVSVDRNHVPNRGGHAWTRYTNSKGTVYILDVAQHYIGELSAIKNDETRWFYERPEDKGQLQKIMDSVKRAFAKFY